MITTLMNRFPRLEGKSEQAGTNSTTCQGTGGCAFVLVSPSGKVGKPIGGCKTCGRVPAHGQPYGTHTEDVETVPDWIAAV